MIDKVRRATQILGLLARHGRSGLLSGADGDEYLVGEGAREGGAVGAGPERLASDLEEMGPTFIKFGQLLSTRFDLLPGAYTDALARLQDRVEPVPAGEVRAVIEEGLGARVRDLFSSFDDTPLASASLGQVHRATTVTGRGRPGCWRSSVGRWRTSWTTAGSGRT